MEKYAEPLRNAGSGSVDIAYTIEENTWNNKTSLQLRLKDIHIGGEQVPAAEKNNKQVLSK